MRMCKFNNINDITRGGKKEIGDKKMRRKEGREK